MGRLRDMARRTPASRERHVDLLRAVAITAVVAGHWLAMVVGYGPEGLTGTSALTELDWAHPLTWLFQVMPLFFMVGGFANAASFTSHRREGGNATSWLLARSARLMPPTTALLLVLGASALTARLAGADRRLIGVAVWLASVPLWFLAAYLAVILLTPMMYRWHERAGLVVPGVLVALVALGDVARLWSGVEAFAYGNFLFGWLAVHQIGFAWRDHRLPARPAVSMPLLLGGLGALLLLTLAGPYPISMVTVPGAGIENTSPPTLALMALATVQLGLALLLRDPAERWLRRRTGPWAVVVAVNAFILTIFLWHMSAAVIATIGLHALGVLPTPPVDSAAWWLGRIPWLALLSVVLTGLVAIFGRVESAERPLRATPHTTSTMPRVESAERPLRATPQATSTMPLVALGYLAAVAGLLTQATAGASDHGPFGLPTLTVVLFLASALLLWCLRARRGPM